MSGWVWSGLVWFGPCLSSGIWHLVNTQRSKQAQADLASMPLKQKETSKEN